VETKREGRTKETEAGEKEEAAKTPSVVHQVGRRRRKLLVPLDDLGHGVQEVLLGHRLAPGPDRVHPGLGAHGPDVGARRVGAEPREQLEADVALAAHRPGVDLEDLRAALRVGQAELDLAVEPAGPQQGGVERVGPVGRHQDLDVAPRVEPVELVDDLQHGALHLVVAARAVVEARAADRVDLVEKDEAGLFRAREREQLADHARALSDVLLHEFGADDADEAGVGPVGDGAGEERLARSWGTVAEDALWRVDSEGDEFLLRGGLFFFFGKGEWGPRVEGGERRS